MRIILASAVAAVALMAPVVASADITTDTVRQRAQQACYDDVNKLCADAIPDEEKIKACMQVNHARLSAGCRKIFDTAGK